MIAGLPLASWALILVAVGAGLAIELAFFRAHRGGEAGPRELDASDAGPRQVDASEAGARSPGHGERAP
ncbi:MAG TPA: hypothetical protein VMK65_09325 [Longimicrobiales bacterium]|nr:hypothetical protein [Longimicrobiales bacterium]